MRTIRMPLVCCMITMLSYVASSCTSKSINVSAHLDQPGVTTNHSSDVTDLLEELKLGNKRFYSGNLQHYHQNTDRIKELAKAQHPKAVVVTCSDSRVPPEIVFDQGLGDIFTVRTAGNVMNNIEEGSIEYAAEHLHTKLVVVMGHEGCGAIGAMLDHHDKMSDDKEECEEEHDHIYSIINFLRCEEEAMEALKDNENRSGAMVRANVIHGVKQLRKSKPILSKLCSEDELQIVGAIYHIDNGEVEFLDI